MAAPPPSYPDATAKGLEREDRVTRLRTYSNYINLLLLLLLLVSLIQSVRESGASLEPFRLPLGSVLFVLLYFFVGINLLVIGADLLELRFTPDPRQKVWRSEDFMANARPIVVIAVIFAVLFSNSALIGSLEDFATTTDSEELAAQGGNYGVAFYPSDPLEFSFLEHVELSCEIGNISAVVVEKRFHDLVVDSRFNLSNDSVRAAIKWNSSEPNRSLTLNLDDLRLDYVEYSLIIYNMENASTKAQYKLRHEISRPLLDRLVLLCVVFFALNLAWGIALFFLRRKFVADFVRREQERLMRNYTLEEVFLIYKDGRLVCHNTRRLKPDLDKDVLTGMLTAVQSFVKDSFAEEKGILNELKYGNLKILMENGPRANLAVVISGTEPAAMRLNMRAMLADIHKKYMGLLDDWDGDTGRLRELKKQIGMLIPEERRLRGEVEEVLLLYRDNRFMMHVTQRGQPDVDDTLLGQLQETVRERVQQAMAMPQAPPLAEIPYGPWKVLLEYGVQLYLAVLISGPEPPDLRPRMRAILEELTTKYEGLLVNWDGSTARITDIRPLLESLFAESLQKKKKRHSSTR